MSYVILGLVAFIVGQVLPIKGFIKVPVQQGVDRIEVNQFVKEEIVDTRNYTKDKKTGEFLLKKHTSNGKVHYYSPVHYYN